MNFSPLGKLTIIYNFEKSPFTKGLWPATRVKEISCAKNCEQEITGQPVYLDILSPQRFESAVCEVNYQGEQPENFRLSLRENNKDWGYQTPTPKIISQNDKNAILQTTFNLSKANYEQGNLRLSFSHKKFAEIKSYTLEYIKCDLAKKTPLKTFLKKLWKK
ncbi:MAG: hypothetical protein WCT18_00165 [Patescibacteria group bacterium]